ncbi:MAG: alpha/beta hydrolase [Gammaproteobacteria bacterium]|nr:alpha/beta hydrolase [Gammaproteobacteria bacterium]
MANKNLDPGVQQFINSVTAVMSEGPSEELWSFPERRRLAEKARAPWAQGGPTMHHSGDGRCATRHGYVRLRIHRPAKGNLPVLVYVHGGGWVMFSVDTHDRLMREYAARAGCAVVGVDYSYAPEARYPIALEQVIDVVRWLRKDGGESLNVDSSRLAIGGDSAGANLTVGSCLQLRDSEDEDWLRAMVLNYGAFSTEISPRACFEYGGDSFMLTCPEMGGFWKNYLRSEADALDPLACPLLARLDGLPPAFLAIAECDVLAEQNIEMANRLRQAGVEVKARVYARASHSFLEAVSISEVSNRAFDETTEWLRSRLADN